ncbi:MAG: hypothetical protein HZB37_04575 [Planctomycetes bacterium]|nr:hypothetical protein [Planctomycetota bacterium]
MKDSSPLTAEGVENAEKKGHGEGLYKVTYRNSKVGTRCPCPHVQRNKKLPKSLI